MDLLNSALGLHEDMRNGTRPVPLNGGGQGGSDEGGAGGTAGRISRQGSVRKGPPKAGGGIRSSGDLREFLSPGEAEPPSTGSEGGASGAREDDSASGTGSAAASLRLYQLPAVREACGGFDPKRCIGEGGFGKVGTVGTFR